jgi:hypothetical protein
LEDDWVECGFLRVDAVFADRAAWVAHGVREVPSLNILPVVFTTFVFTSHTCSFFNCPTLSQSLALVKLRLRSLMPEGPPARLMLGAWLVWSMFHGSVLRICDMFYVSRPAASTALTLVVLLRCRTVAARVNDRGPMSPGLSRLAVIFCVA